MSALARWFKGADSGSGASATASEWALLGRRTV